MVVVLLVALCVSGGRARLEDFIIACTHVKINNNDFLLESRAVVFILHIITFLMYHSLVWFYCERRSTVGEWYLCASSLKIKRFNLNKLTNIMFFGAVYYKYVLLCLLSPGHITDTIRIASVQWLYYEHIIWLWCCMTTIDHPADVARSVRSVKSGLRQMHFITKWNWNYTHESGTNNLAI